MSIGFVFDDGGRKASGFRGDAGDCVTRAIAIATDVPYPLVYDQINLWACRGRRSSRKTGWSSARSGVHKPTYTRYLTFLGWHFTPTMGIGTGCRVHLRASELPLGRLICSLSRHLVAVLDGVVHDTHDPSREGTRCVYGYFQRA